MTTRARIVVYTGYGTPERVVVRGRVIEDPTETADPNANQLSNMVRNLDTLESDEVKFAPVHITLPDRQVSVLTDIDGLFDVPVAMTPRPLAPGNHPITVELGDKPGFSAKPQTGEVRVIPDEPGVALLSDFDDTVVNSYVKNKARLLYQTLAKNAAQLDPVPHADEAYRKAEHAGVRMFFYLSGSPIQLYDRIASYLELKGFPRGIILLKNLGDDPLFAQLEYKVGRLEKVLAAFPQLRFILVGDSGEKDPEIYAEVRRRHPGRVAAIVIRRAPGTDDAQSRFKDMTVVDDYAGQTDLLARLGALPADDAAPRRSPSSSRPSSSGPSSSGPSSSGPSSSRPTGAPSPASPSPREGER